MLLAAFMGCAKEEQGYKRPKLLLSGRHPDVWGYWRAASGTTITDTTTIHYFQLSIQAEVYKPIPCNTTPVLPLLWQSPAGRQTLGWFAFGACQGSAVNWAIGYCPKNHPTQSHMAGLHNTKRLLHLLSGALGCSWPTLHHLQAPSCVGWFE